MKKILIAGVLVTAAAAAYATFAVRRMLAGLDIAEHVDDRDATR